MSWLYFTVVAHQLLLAIIIQIMDGLESDMDFDGRRKVISDENVKNPYWTTEPSINCYIMPKNSLYSMFLAHF
jgi:hypothetical protein